MPSDSRMLRDSLILLRASTTSIHTALKIYLAKSLLQVQLDHFNVNHFCVYYIHLELALSTLPDNYRQVFDYVFPEDEQPHEPDSVMFA